MNSEFSWRTKRNSPSPTITFTTTYISTLFTVLLNLYIKSAILFILYFDPKNEAGYSSEMPLIFLISTYYDI
jgi:hypothetical protein